MNDQIVQVSLVTTPNTARNLVDIKKKRKASEDASICLAKLRDPEYRDEVWLDLLQQCLRHVSHEEVGTTPEEVIDIGRSICLDHASQHLQLLRDELRYRRDVSSRITLVKRWLIKGNLSYADIKATEKEQMLFGELAS